MHFWYVYIPMNLEKTLQTSSNMIMYSCAHHARINKQFWHKSHPFISKYFCAYNFDKSAQGAFKGDH